MFALHSFKTVGPVSGHRLPMRHDSAKETLEGYGRRVRHFRERRGLTQQQLADAVGEIFQTIGKLERGEQRLRFDQAEKLAPALNVEPWQFFAEPPAAAGVPMRYVVSAAFSERAARWDEPSHHSEPAPSNLADPEDCFAVEVGDDSVDRMYPEGSILFVRPIEQAGGRLTVGTKIVIAHFATDAETGDIFEVLAGRLDRSHSGDLMLVVQSGNRRAMPGAVWIRRATAEGGHADRFYSAPVDTEPTIDYRPEPGDHAEILGVIERAVTVE